MSRDPYPASVLGLLAQAGDRPVFERGDRVVSGTELLGLVRRVAAGLRAAGVGPGDGLAMMLGVTPEAFAAITAGYVVGARVCGIRPGLPTAHLRHILARDITAVVTDAGTDVEAVGSGADATADGYALPRLSLADLASTPDPGGAPVLSGRPEEVARLTYTSGSTGRPKACAQTYAGLDAAWAARPDRWPPVIRDLATRMSRYLVFGSLSSQVMFEYGLVALAAGGAMVVADDPSLPDAVIRHRASAMVSTVPRLRRLVAGQRTEPVDLSCLRAVMVSGSPLTPDLHREALDVLGPVVFHGYGQTETGMIAMAGAADPAGSVGIPPAAVQVVVRGPDGGPVPAGVDGELYVCTPGQAVGYWADPAETAEVFVDGWVRTRDLGHLDPTGRLHLVGRTRDVIIVNANLHYAGPIEQVLGSHPDVAEAYVLGVPDADTGEAVHAFVVPAAGRTPEHAALRRLVAERLGAACVPARITEISEVPIAPSGKPDKRSLPSILVRDGSA